MADSRDRERVGLFRYKTLTKPFVPYHREFVFTRKLSKLAIPEVQSHEDDIYSQLGIFIALNGDKNSTW